MQQNDDLADSMSEPWGLHSLDCGAAWPPDVNWSRACASVLSHRIVILPYSIWQAAAGWDISAGDKLPMNLRDDCQSGMN